MGLEAVLQRWTACLVLGATGACRLGEEDVWLGLGGLCLLLLGAWLVRRLRVTLSTWRAMALAPLFARRLATWVRSQDYTEQELLRADGAAEAWVERRQKALDRLAMFFQTHYANSMAWGDAIRDSFSDLRFTDANRVPFPFMRVMRDKFNLCAVVTESKEPRLHDLDGHWSLDVGGSYGVNVAGFERYKLWMQQGLERVKDVGPVLGPLHPLVADNIQLSFLDHPQYVGTLLSIWGFFLIMRFPYDDWSVLPVLETVYYTLGAYCERED